MHVHLLTGLLRRALCTCALPAVALAAEPVAVTVTLRLDQPGSELPADFCGASYEVALAKPGGDGVRYFRPDHRALVDTFRLLGIRSLRIGGNTSDRDAVQPPSRSDLDSLFGFARAADAKVIYCLRLHGGDPAADAATAKYLVDRYGPLIDSFSIGQEPSAYPVGPARPRTPEEERAGAPDKYPYEAYRDDWRRFEAAIAAAVPGIRFCGPSVHNNPAWTRKFLADFGRGAHVALVTEHLYPGGAAGLVSSPAAGRDEMLGPGFVRTYQRLYDGFVPEARADGLPYRLEEANSFYNGGAQGVSDTFASALWGLDFMWWWAAHGAAGINFHGGDTVAAGGRLRISRYAAFVTAGPGFHFRPLGYGIKAFELGARGRIVPAEISANPGGLNLSAYASLAPDGTLLATVINKEHGPGGRAARVALAAGRGRGRASTLALAAPGGDVAATAGVTLGGAAIGDDASWAGTWAQAPAADAAGTLAISLPPATALVIKYAAP
ncbi:MAG TPA: hypothetical protein VHC86_12765 [Opitutaceae bacterium]|nr:hypothetical protein [Opitutaceae bacterium]